jgi:serine/threonine protein kinase
LQKPDNIGFDSQGVLKIFDFGLAKELLDKEKAAEEGLYHMTGFTGGIRYMAPEVGLRKPYGLKADVYSWSMIMWYSMALEPPMGMYTPNMFIERVFTRGSRPIVKDKWPEGLKTLLKHCWSPNIDDRPVFRNIMMALKTEVDLVDPEIASFMGDSMHG